MTDVRENIVWGLIFTLVIVVAFVLTESAISQKVLAQTHAVSSGISK